MNDCPGWVVGLSTARLPQLGWVGVEPGRLVRRGWSWHTVGVLRDHTILRPGTSGLGGASFAEAAPVGVVVVLVGVVFGC